VLIPLFNFYLLLFPLPLLVPWLKIVGTTEQEAEEEKEEIDQTAF
jgi:hypothetical protein